MQEPKEIERMTRRIKADQVSVAKLIEQVGKFQHLVALQPQNEVYAKTLESLYRRLDEQKTVEMELFTQKHGGSDWWELAMKQYPIIQDEVTGKFVVVSEAREWTEPKDWEFSHKFDAILKVQQLVKWLDDGRKRGFGCRDKDIERLAPMHEVTAAFAA